MEEKHEHDNDHHETYHVDNESNLRKTLYPYEIVFQNRSDSVGEPRRAKFYDLMEVPCSMSTTKRKVIKVTINR